jgi:hypothetical protein
MMRIASGGFLTKSAQERKKTMKLKEIALLIVTIVALSACAGVPLTARPPEPVIYGSGQDVTVNARGGVEVCDKRMAAASSREEMNAVRECYNKQLAIHRAGLAQQREDRRFAQSQDRFEAREQEAAFRRIVRAVDTGVRVIERLDRLGN